MTSTPSTSETAPMPDLTDLIARVEGAGGADRELDALIAVSLGWTRDNIWGEPNWRFGDWATPDSHAAKALPFFTASLDAAMTLVPDGQFGAQVVLHSDGSGGSVCWDPFGNACVSKAATPALALCAAALKARNHQRGKS